MIDLSTFQYIKLKFSIIDLWNSSLIFKTRLASYPSSCSLSARGRKEKGVCMGTRLGHAGGKRKESAWVYSLRTSNF